MTESGSERDLSGMVLDRYRLIRRIGAGGMGTVYEGQHELLDRKVAVKVLSPKLASQEIPRKRFLREARAASRVAHPNIIEIYDVGFAGEHVFLVMELLPGQDLGERLEGRPKLDWPETRAIVLQVSAALAAAHEVGVIHRDVKPSNCFLVEGPDCGEPPRVKVLDFGIARVTSQIINPATELTTTGEVFGTVGYMPPEISHGITKDPRSDIYALGVMMFRMLTGELPFNGTALEVIAQHIGRAPPLPRSLDPSIPQAVEGIILRALEKDPADRYPTMHELRAAVEDRLRASPAAPSISRAEVIDIDELPHLSAPRGSTTAYGREPELVLEPLPPPPPGQTQAVLELDVPEGWKPGDPVEPREPSPKPRRSLAGPMIGLGVIAAIAVGVWTYRPTLEEGLEEGVGIEHEADMVLLLIDTKPKKATVFVDDEIRTERPMRVPRSEEYLRIRVEAKGYEPWTIQVQPKITRRLEVVLERKKKRRR